MASSMEKAELHVEGDDDLHTIIQLLIRHGIDYDSRRDELPDLKKADGVEKLLTSMEAVTMASAGRVVGFVLDANGPVPDRWRAVTGQLSKTGVSCPERPPAGGFIGCSRHHATVGVWLMPDNQREGKLETLLRSLIDEQDTLIGHAEASTTAAKGMGARFSEPDQIKAVLHAWLAWQEEPGRPYGSAIRNRYFRCDSEAAKAFVKWFKQLFGTG